METNVFVKGIREQTRLTQWVQLNIALLAFTLSFFLLNQISQSYLIHLILPSIYEITQCLGSTDNPKSSWINESKNSLFNVSH